MNFIGFCVRHPVPVIVGVVLIILFGVISIFQIPRQLTPTVEVPVVGVSVVWPGAAPQDMESSIVERIEEQLNAVDGMREMTSTSTDSMADIRLEFDWGTDRTLAGVDVINKLNLVRDLPKDSLKPTIFMGERFAHPICFISLVGEGQNSDQLRQYAVDNLQSYFKRISGVSRVDVYGGRERHALVTFDPHKLAAYHISPAELGQVLAMANRDTPAGRIDEQTGRWTIRTVGEFRTNEDIESVILKRPGMPDVRLADLVTADVDAYKDAEAYVRIDGTSGVVLAVQKKTGENVVDIIREVKKMVGELNADLLATQKMKMAIEYDEAVYIDQAIQLLQEDVWLSAILAGAVLVFFLRSARAILTICISIPISFVGTFIFLWMLGRTLNVVSLAGLTFAVGRLVDDSIVVLENIYRHREMGKTAWQAALDGAKEVWLAVLASTLTTVAVFLPVFFIKEEAGQLFRDISLAIAISVILSLVVSVTVVPMLTARILSRVKPRQEGSTAESGVTESRGDWVGKWLLFGWLGSGFRAILMRMLRWILATTPRRIVVAGGIFLFFSAATIVFAIVTPTSYLPTGNQNFVMGFALTEAGASIDHNLAVAIEAETRVRALPQVERFFVVTLPDMMFFGARAADGDKAREMAGAISAALGNVLPDVVPEQWRAEWWKKNGQYYKKPIPGIMANAEQIGLFQRQGMTGGQTVSVTIRGNNIQDLYRIAEAMKPRLMAVPGIAFINPSYKLGKWELRLSPDPNKAAAVGLNKADVGYAMASFVNGIKVDDYRQENGRQIDLTLRGEPRYREHIEDLEDLPLWTPVGRVVTIGQIAPPTPEAGVTSVDHLERTRCVKLDCIIMGDTPVGQIVDAVNADVLQPMKDNGAIPPDYIVELRGSARDLAKMWNALKWSFALALVITYLLMAALFESFTDPLVIILSVPLAVVGGFAMLFGMMFWNMLVLGTSPPMLDVVTMLGFIIMIGIIVNNAILVVAQTLNFMKRDNLPLKEAVLAGVDSRLRPIFMSTLTSVLGMAPLVFRPGPGSELYQGLGAVIVGGLLISTVFTLILTPVLFTFGHSVTAAMHRFFVRAHVVTRDEEGRLDG
jgi:hydrophobic/amphiphilic exporter-1 (mainly G- bacteria), HAE1 family